MNGNWQCFTLEDVVRDYKIPGQTAIPSGKYRIIMTFSSRFSRQLPLLLNVPDFDGIRIHAGNTDKDTKGCVLVGKVADHDFVSRSREAFSELYDKLVTALAIEKCTMEIIK